jgi:hypothetical protein
MIIVTRRCNSPKDDPAMTTRRATENPKALDAFIAAKLEIDALLERLATLSADHFQTDPDEIH